MVTKEELKKMLLGKRVLYTMTLSTQVPPIEAEVLEISPSGNYIKLQKMDGQCSWEIVSSIYIADVLDDEGYLEVKARWIPVLNETYWHIDEAGEVASSVWSDSNNDKKRFAYGNVFKNYQQAESFKDKFKKALFNFHRMEAMNTGVSKEKEQANNKPSA
jgi:hypothetical protein